MAEDMSHDYGRLLQLVDSLTHLDGRMRPKPPGHRDQPTLSQQTPAQRVSVMLSTPYDNDLDILDMPIDVYWARDSKLNEEAAAWLPKGFVELPRFEIPLDVHHLEALTPVQYLTKYCVITSRVKKLLYHRQYTKYREAKVDGIDSLEKVKRALKDVCTFSINTKSFSPSEGSLNYFLHGILNFELSDNIRINFKTFMGMAALAERIFNPNYMSSWWENEKRLESDYLVYKKLREQELSLKDKIDQRETEQARLHDQRLVEASRNPRKNIKQRVGSEDPDDEEEDSECTLVIEVSPSENVLIKQVQEHRNKLEKKISITKILELEGRPNKCPKEVMEQVDFHALQWKLKDIDVSLSMQRLIRIIINL